MTQMTRGLFWQMHEREAQRDGPATLVKNGVIHVQIGGDRPGSITCGPVELHNLAQRLRCSLSEFPSHADGAANPWLMQGSNQVQDANYDSKTPDQLSCARNRGNDKSQLLLINNWLNHLDAIISDAHRSTPKRACTREWSSAGTNAA